jgi:mevalonate kinase
MVGFASEIETRLEFERSWGLGSSSTLVASFAKWLDINPYELLRRTFGGSGYDVACAGADGPILFSNRPEPPAVKPIDLLWNFKDQLSFIYLGNKQDSRSGIRRYEDNPAKREILEKMTALTRQMLDAADLHEFTTLMIEHEAITSKAIGLPTVKALHFSDFEGSVKSLGAWGGDFVLAASEGNPEDVRTYFASKGLNTAFSWNDLILEPNGNNE